MGTTSPPAPTTSFSTVTNLNANATPGTVYSTPLQIYDSLGATHSLLFTYTKGATPGSWGCSVSTDGGATVTGFPTSLQFDGKGMLTAPTTNPVLSISGWPNGATSPPTTWNITSGGASNLTGFSAASSTAATSQDGYGSGIVRSMVVDQNGVITGSFTNGQTMPMAQVAIANFANIAGLAKQGENMWGETLASGSASIGAANMAGRGSVLGANLELSNVDVAEEFTRLIINQRGYQANSRVVTTADSLLQETLNLIR